MTALAELPDLLTLPEVADVLRAKALNRARAGRALVEQHGLPTVASGKTVLVPKWAVEQLLEAPARGVA